MDVSRRRQRAKSLHAQMGECLQLLLSRPALLAASPYKHRLKCGKAGGKCAEGDYRHEMDCISYVDDGNSRTRVIPKGTKADVVKMADAYKRFKDARRKMKELFEELLGEVDRIGEAQTCKGMERFERLCAKSKKAKADSKERRQ